MVEEMDVDYSKVLAITSHLPHLIAYTIVGTAFDFEQQLQNDVIRYSASGFRDFTRIAASDPVNGMSFSTTVMPCWKCWDGSTKTCRICSVPFAGRKATNSKSCSTAPGQSATVSAISASSTSRSGWQDARMRETVGSLLPDCHHWVMPF